MRKILKEYRTEIIAALIAALGVFLLVERLEIRSTVLDSYRWLTQELPGIALTSLADLGRIITGITVSDFIGWILITATAVFAIWRIRYRFLHSRWFRITSCPRCDGPLHRVHRSAFDRILTQTLLKHGRRYGCKDDECGWSGLRHYIYKKPSSLV